MSRHMATDLDVWINVYEFPSSRLGVIICFSLSLLGSVPRRRFRCSFPIEVGKGVSFFSAVASCGMLIHTQHVNEGELSVSYHFITTDGLAPGVQEETWL